MRIQEINQVDFQGLRQIEFDIVIAGLGYESRSTHLARLLLNGSHVHRKFAFAFIERKNLSRKKNEKFFLREKYKKIDFSEDNDKEIKATLSDLIRFVHKDEISILIDYSCMTRVWYASMLHLFIKEEFKAKRINLFFSYSPAEFSVPIKVKYPNVKIVPIAEFCKHSLPDKQLALVLGLGYDHERALGVCEYIDTAKTFAFYTKPSHDKKFTKEVEKNNKNLLSRLPKGNIFPYPMLNLIQTSNLLSSLCLGLEIDYRVILAPLGPKPFSLLCLLLIALFPEKDLNVWRVSLGQTGKPVDRVATGNPIICKVIFEKS